MFRTGWAFHVELQELAAAALVWQRGIKPLRLVRQRSLARLRSGEDCLNLASLPSELMSIIEDELFDSSFESMSAQEPFKIECVCRAFRRGFRHWPPFLEAIEDYAHNYAIAKAVARTKPAKDGEKASASDIRLRQDDFEVGLAAFCETEQYAKFHQEYRDIHVAEGKCKAEDEKYMAWILEILDALRMFEDDFGLLRLCPRDAEDGLPEMARVPVFFRAHSQLIRRKPPKEELLVLAPADTKRLARFYTLFGLAPDGGRAGSDAMADIFWVTAHLMDVPFTEVAVDCKAVQEVEEHNSLLRMKQKVKANERRKPLAIQAEK